MNKEISFAKEAYIHYDYFVNIARRYTQNQMDAQDLVQDTYARAFRFYDSFRKGSNCKAWLFTIMRNIFINYYRKYKNVVEFEYNEVTEKNVPEEESEFTAEELIRLMANIRDEFRCVIILFHINEYSLKEISVKLNWPLGTVKSRLYRARKKFREVLENSMQAGTA